MRKELDQKLCEEFPLLYRNRRRSMKETCMCWGFSHGDGWYDIIYRLSAQLEPLIQKIAEENKHGKCYHCGCKYFGHRGMPSGKRICRTVHKLPYRAGRRWYGCCVPQWKRDMGYALTNRWKSKQPVRNVWRTFKRLIRDDWKYTKYRNLHNGIYRPVNKLLNLLYKVGLHYKKPCECLEWEPSHPRASQVKEKFGTLSFYMDSATDEIYKLIRVAEEESGVTCESCGEPGRRRHGGWVHTFCDGCQEKYEQAR